MNAPTTPAADANNPSQVTTKNYTTVGRIRQRLYSPQVAYLCGVSMSVLALTLGQVIR